MKTFIAAAILSASMATHADAAQISFRDVNAFLPVSVANAAASVTGQAGLSSFLGLAPGAPGRTIGLLASGSGGGSISAFVTTGTVPVQLQPPGGGGGISPVPLPEGLMLLLGGLGILGGVAVFRRRRSLV
jgi:hypothetical protein